MHPAHGPGVARQVEEAALGSQTTAQATQALAATVHEVALTASELAHVADPLKATSAHFRL